MRFILMFAFLIAFWLPRAYAAEERQPVTISVVVANPSKEKVQTFPVKIDLPAEIKPENVLETSGLTIEYDDRRSVYFLYNAKVQMQPKETRTFEVVVENVWFIEDDELSPLETHTDVILQRLEGSTYYEAGKKIADAIYRRLEQIRTRQTDEALSQKRRIGAFRQHLTMIEEIKEDLDEMEKFLQFVGGVPVPEMLEESELKSDAPSTKTTWLIIFTIMVFIGLLGAQFFFTWHKRAQAEQEFFQGQKEIFPGTVRDDKKISEASGEDKGEKG